MSVSFGCKARTNFGFCGPFFGENRYGRWIYRDVFQAAE